MVVRAAFIARQIEERGHRHVHAHWATHPALAALVVKELTGTGYSFTAHAHDLYLDRAMLEEKVREARFVVTISEFNRALLRDLYGEAAAQKTTVIRCGVDPARFQPRPHLARKGPAVIACIAGLRDYKGQRYLVDACAALRERGVRFRCLLVGDGSGAAPRGRSRRARPGGRAPGGAAAGRGARAPRDHGRPRAPERHHRRRDDGRDPRGAHGGDGHGVPRRLDARVRDPELVHDGKTGLLVEQRDATALADAIQRLVEDPALARRLGMAVGVAPCCGSSRSSGTARCSSSGSRRSSGSRKATAVRC